MLNVCHYPIFAFSWPHDSSSFKFHTICTYIHILFSKWRIKCNIFFLSLFISHNTASSGSTYFPVCNMKYLFLWMNKTSLCMCKCSTATSCIYMLVRWFFFLAIDNSAITNIDCTYPCDIGHGLHDLILLSGLLGISIFIMGYVSIDYME